MNEPGAKSVATIPDLSQLSSEIDMRFGEARWESHLGGFLRGAESEGGVSWRWAGESRCWCVLPELDSGRDYAVRLEVAPLAAYQTELRELIVELGETPVLRRVLPMGSDNAEAKIPFDQFDFSEAAARVRSGAAPPEFKLVWRWIPNPELAVKIHDVPVANLVYETRPDVQIRDFLLRRELLREENVLEFSPNFAISSDELADGGESARLSFRFFRMRFYALD